MIKKQIIEQEWPITWYFKVMTRLVLQSFSSPNYDYIQATYIHALASSG